MSAKASKTKKHAAAKSARQNGSSHGAVAAAEPSAAAIATAEPEDALSILRARVGDLEGHLEARREEVERLQSELASARDAVSSASTESSWARELLTDHAQRLAALEPAVERLAELARRVAVVESSQKLLMDLTEESRARLDVLETGGLRGVIARLICLEAVDRALLAPVPWETASGRALSVITKQFGARSGALLFLDTDGQSLHMTARHPATVLPPLASMKLQDSPSAAQSVSDRSVRRVPVDQENAMCLLQIGESLPGGAGSVYSAPVIVTQRPRGVLTAVITRPEPLAQEDEDLFGELSARVALAFEAEVVRRKAERTKGALV